MVEKRVEFRTVVVKHVENNFRVSTCIGYNPKSYKSGMLFEQTYQMVISGEITDLMSIAAILKLKILIIEDKI